MPARQTPTLDQELNRIGGALEALRLEARELLANAPITKAATPYVAHPNERYILARPDGHRYWNVPGADNLYSGFTNVAAAFRVAKSVPGARVYDVDTKTYITEDTPS